LYGPDGLVRAGRWLLQDAKARFSELVRRVHSEGPQHVTVHGRDELVMISADEFHRLRGDRTGDSSIFPVLSSIVTPRPPLPAYFCRPLHRLMRQLSCLQTHENCARTSLQAGRE
jgi:prevent-host-death family protein